MTPAHLQEIRSAKLVYPADHAEAMYVAGVAQGHREVLLQAYDALAAEHRKVAEGFCIAEARYLRRIQDLEAEIKAARAEVEATKEMFIASVAVAAEKRR